jgi:hypothetical protein
VEVYAYNLSAWKTQEDHEFGASLRYIARCLEKEKRERERERKKGRKEGRKKKRENFTKT